MTRIQRSDIKDFVVSYEALWDALRVPEKERNRDTWNSIFSWATILRRAQEACGIEIMPKETCTSHIETARLEMARIDATIKKILAPPMGSVEVADRNEDIFEVNR